MLINNKSDYANHVKFVGYTGRYPKLCLGVLTLMIDDEEVKFGHECDGLFSNEDPDNPNFDSFWMSGGGISRNYSAYQSEWLIDVNDIPEQYKKYAAEIDSVFNENVPHGCCGGCL